MMNKKEFAEMLKEDVFNRLPSDVRSDITIDYIEVVKMNDLKLHGLSFRNAGSDAAPTLYVDDMYRAYTEGADLRYLATDLANAYIAAKDEPAPPTVSLRYDDVKDKLTIRLLEKKRNRKFLAKMPYISVGHGFAITADINMGEERGGDWRIPVNKGVLEELEVDEETLFADAIESSAVFEPPMLVEMGNALFESDKINLLDMAGPIDPEKAGNMYVLTNTSGSLGAAVLFYPEIRERAAEILGTDYYILPSSVHEVILVPDTAGIDEKDLCDMVRKANRSVVEEGDILSDEVYHYSKGGGMAKITHSAAA